MNPVATIRAASGNGMTKHPIQLVHFWLSSSLVPGIWNSKCPKNIELPTLSAISEALMKTRILLSAVVVAFGLVGCASTGSSNAKSLLAASGFREKTPETAKQKQLYASAPAYKVQRITANGKTFYAYKDEKSGTALVGDESNYQQYENRAIGQRIARQEHQASEMRRDAAYGWHGAYGRGIYGPPAYGPPGVRYGAIRR